MTRAPRLGRAVLRRPPESVIAASAAFVFSLSLGMATVAFPLIALYGGFGVGSIGVLVTVSAAAQLAARSVLGPLLRRLPDRYLVIASGVVLAASTALLALPAHWAGLAASQALQGAARALFWTGSQTHAVRTSRTSARGLASLNVVAGVGGSVGSLVAGLLLGFSPLGTVLIAATIALAAIVPGLAMARLETYDMPSRAARRRRGTNRAVLGAGWAGATAGGWRALLSSYVPVMLTEARHATSSIGLSVALATAASVVGGLAAGAVRPTMVRRALVLAVVLTGGGMTIAAAGVDMLTVAVVALALSGLGAGLAQTLGPAVAADSVPPAEQGLAIAASGTFRAGALLVAPFCVAGAAIPLGVAPAVAGAGLLMVLPAWLAHRWVSATKGTPVVDGSPSTDLR